MKKEKTILLGGLILVLALGVYAIALAALDVGNDLNMWPDDPVGSRHKILKLGDPAGDQEATTWGYVKASAGGVSTDSTVGIWRQSASPFDVYLNSTVGENVLSGNVGIGTNDPQYLLDLQGTGVQILQVKSTSSTGNRGAEIRLGDSTGTYGEFWEIGSSGDAASKDLYFNFQNTIFTGEQDKKFWISQYANDDISINIGDSNVDGFWKILSQGTGANNPLIFSRCAGDVCSALDGQVWFSAVGTEARVSIGTASPQASLHVQNGDAWINNNLLVGGFIGITSCGPAGEAGLKIGDDSYIFDDACASWPPGPGVPIPDDTLYITSGDAIGIKSGNDGKTGTNYGVYVGNNGYVGIGASTVGYQLDVAGTARFTQSVIVAVPENSNHAATKGYVDTAVVPEWSTSIEIGGTGSETCDSNNVGRMRYYTSGEEMIYARFEICMQTADKAYGWYTIKYYSWVPEGGS